MEYIKYTELSEKNWDEWIQKLSDCPFNFTSAKIAFDTEYSVTLLANESFLLKEGKRLLAAAVVYVEEGPEGKRRISWNGSYCPGIVIDTSLSYQEQERYGKLLLGRIDALAEKYCCCEIWLRSDPLINFQQKNPFFNYNYLLKYNYMDNSSLTQLIDLRKEEKELYADVRKGHKSDIKKGDKKYTVDIYDRETITGEEIEWYRRIYEADAGKVTRNSQLYLYYLRFIQAGMGVLAIARLQDEPVAVMIVTFFHKTAYYSSYGELTDCLEGVPAGHSMQWRMIRYLKSIGIESYEIGEQVFGDTHYSSPEQKLKDISRFKRGFGGYTVPFWRGRKILR